MSASDCVYLPKPMEHKQREPAAPRRTGKCTDLAGQRPSNGRAVQSPPAGSFDAPAAGPVRPCCFYWVYVAGWLANPIGHLDWEVKDLAEWCFASLGDAFRVSAAVAVGRFFLS
jgi:hypothetical protein